MNQIGITRNETRLVPLVSSPVIATADIIPVCTRTTEEHHERYEVPVRDYLNEECKMLTTHAWADEKLQLPRTLGAFCGAENKFFPRATKLLSSVHVNIINIRRLNEL